MSVLSDMTQGIMQQKAEKATKLTAIAGESPTTVAQVAAGIPEVPQVFLTNEAVKDIALDIRKQAGILIEVADALDLQTGLGTAPAPADTSVEDTKAAEKAADKKAATKLTPQAQKLVDHMASLKVDAEAATYASADAGTEEPEAPATPVADGWTCPDHGATSLEQLVSRRDRKYMACTVTDCHRFEK